MYYNQFGMFEVNNVFFLITIEKKLFLLMTTLLNGIADMIQSNEQFDELKYAGSIQNEFVEKYERKLEQFCFSSDEKKMLQKITKAHFLWFEANKNHIF